MKKFTMIFLAVIMIFSLCIGTAFAKKGEQPKTENKGKSVTEQISKGQAKQELKNKFKEAVTPYLNQIKANKKLWGQAGGLEELEGISEDIENAIEKMLTGDVVVTNEQLLAIKAEVDKIKTFKEALKTDKSAITTAWHNYIVAKKTYNIDQAIGALQKVIDLQKTRIEARKGIFASMVNIINILKEALLNPQSAPVTSPSPSESPSPSASAA